MEEEKGQDETKNSARFREQAEQNTDMVPGNQTRLAR